MNESHAHQKFAYDEIDRLIDGRCDADRAPDGSFDARTFNHAEYTAGLAEFARWMVLGAHRDGPGRAWIQTLARILHADMIGRRAICAAWILRPELFARASLSEVGRLPGVDGTRKMLCYHVADFEATFGVRSRGMRTRSNREQLSLAALKRWQRERKAGDGESSG